MALGSQVTVGTTPTELARGSGTTGSDLIVRNASTTGSAFLGGPGVTTATGFELPAGSSLGLTIDAGENLLAVAASGTVRVDILRAS